MPIIFCRRPISKKSTKSRTEVSVEEDEYPESDLSTPEYIAKKDLIQLQSKMATVSTQLLESIAKMVYQLDLNQLTQVCDDCSSKHPMTTTFVSGKIL
ncbi:hypothetical protein L2E82_21170 [Cichorium intybus]|uniref:Uncharacterized protein n=1 Tax=Cichorium intybus TaxID=13427 RepID=A0ACB9DV52_CICIN|nr:hypothetical protein L2E82_21170 [Cichorium intybus]